MVSTLNGNKTIEIQDAKTHLKELFNKDLSKTVTIPDIMKKIAEKYNISVEEMKSKSRHSKIVQPRFLSMYISRQLTDATTTDIGREFGDRDHSTVLNANNKIEDEMKKNPEFKEYVEDLLIELRS